MDQPSEQAMVRARELWHELAALGLLSTHTYQSEAKQGVTLLATALDEARADALQDGIRRLDKRGIQIKKDYPGAVGLVVSSLVRNEADALRALADFNGLE